MIPCTLTPTAEQLEKRAFAEDAIEISKREQYRENEKQRKLMGYCHFNGVIDRGNILVLVMTKNFMLDQ